MSTPDTYSPSTYGAVTVDTLFADGGQTYEARGLIASADGTITVTRKRGTEDVSVASFPVFKGYNVFRCTKVTDLGGLTLFWFA